MISNIRVNAKIVCPVETGESFIPAEHRSPIPSQCLPVGIYIVNGFGEGVDNAYLRVPAHSPRQLRLQSIVAPAVKRSQLLDGFWISTPPPRSTALMLSGAIARRRTPSEKHTRRLAEGAFQASDSGPLKAG